MDRGYESMTKTSAPRPVEPIVARLQDEVKALYVMRDVVAGIRSKILGEEEKLQSVNNVDRPICVDALLNEARELTTNIMGNLATINDVL